jgi:hypothetical protein
VGGFDSGDDRTLRTFKVLATGVTDFSIESPGHIPDSLSSEGLELEERELRFTIIIQTPGALRLTFEKVEVVRLDDRLTAVEPWVSGHELWVSSAEGDLPSADDRIQMIANAGIKTNWNFCGEATAIKQHPLPFQYDGWCLQLWDSGRLDEVVFLIHSQSKPGGYSLSIRNRAASGRLWDAVCRAAASSPTVVIRAGNVEMSPSEWSRYLDDGILPDPPRGWSYVNRSTESGEA